MASEVLKAPGTNGRLLIESHSHGWVAGAAYGHLTEWAQKSGTSCCEGSHHNWDKAHGLAIFDTTDEAIAAATRIYARLEERAARGAMPLV